MDSDEEADAPIVVEAEPETQVVAPVVEPKATPPPHVSDQEVTEQQIILPPELAELVASIEVKALFSDKIDGFTAQTFNQATDVAVKVGSRIIAYVDPVVFWARMDSFQNELQKEYMDYTSGTVAVTSAVITAGYIFWMMKGGYMLAAMVSQLPAWQTIDPLPIFDAVAGGYWDEDDALEDMF